MTLKLGINPPTHESEGGSETFEVPHHGNDAGTSTSENPTSDRPWELPPQRANLGPAGPGRIMVARRRTTTHKPAGTTLVVRRHCIAFSSRHTLVFLFGPKQKIYSTYSILH